MPRNATARTRSAKFALPLRLTRVGIALVLLAAGVSALNDRSVKMSGVSIVWLSNGLLAGVLLCTPKRQWAAFFGLGFAVDFCVNIALKNPPGPAVVFAVLNMIEVAVAVLPSYSKIGPRPDLTEAVQFRSFLLYSVFLSTATTSILASLFIQFHYGTPFTQAFRYWFAADVLGMATVLPLYLSFHQGKRFSPRSHLEELLLFVLLCAVTFVSFRFTNLPVLWLVLAFLLLLGIRLGFTGSAAGLLLVTFIGGYLTVEGFGPLTSSSGSSLPEKILFFQSFIALSMLALYGTEVAMSSNRRTQAELQESETRFRSLTETSRDVIVLADLNGIRKYVSPAVTELFGFRAAELTGQPFTQLVHSEDLPAVQQLFADLLAGQTTNQIAYRSLRKDGTYRWVESNARLVLNAKTDTPNGFVYVMRDIADRKEAEQKLLAAFQSAEKLAMVDGLTGVANRRHFDQTFEKEWQRAKREATPLSLILIDVDCFKSYNDLYGHLAGDECLRIIAKSAQSSLHRTTDLLARYGGEEFAGVLPHTQAHSAKLVAERIRTIVEDTQLPHAGVANGFITVSLGIATMTPSYDAQICTLIELADAALYRAKLSGRNRTEIACKSIPPVENPQAEI